ncbi:single-stranded DNA-binding protein [Pectobacterium parmentieri]|uniref:DNA-binding protein n=1 Tax=Pectobacterium parmentieri TaxID=1905730 RepID=UPI0013746993|nr:DNA-binding protein [Pectobacterium parmentieri]QHQ15592.1 single-stranded DNA-binding protein [Pectobacterium parmentieri]
MSLLLKGKFLGARNREFTNAQGSYSFYELGVENQRPDGWGGQQSVQTAVRIPKKFVDAGILEKFQRLAGKNVLVPVWVDAYTGKSGAQVQITLESDQIDILPDQK